MIEFDSAVLEVQTAPKPAAKKQFLPTEPGFYLGKDRVHGGLLALELKADGKFHWGIGTLNDPERYAPLVRMSTGSDSEELSITQKFTAAAEIMDILSSDPSMDAEVAHHARLFSVSLRRSLELETDF